MKKSSISNDVQNPKKLPHQDGLPQEITVFKWQKFNLEWRVKFRWENHHPPPPPLQENQICFNLRKFLIFVVHFSSTHMRIEQYEPLWAGSIIFIDLFSGGMLLINTHV